MSCKDSKSPINAFIKYFHDVKPYHTKLLEVIETYRFHEELNVSIDEELKTHIKFKNDPLCKGTGFGLVWDDECGFDAITCCDLFNCEGGYGLIYDNSDVLVDVPIISLNEETGEIVVSGNYQQDRLLNVIKNDPNDPTIRSFPAPNKVLIEGNFLTGILPHSIFMVVPLRSFTVASIDDSEKELSISGDITSDVGNQDELELYDSSTSNNGVYLISEIDYNSGTDTTVVKISTDKTLDNVTAKIKLKANNPNSGAYEVDSVSYDGTNTEITIKNGTFDFSGNDFTSNAPAILLRTGFLQNRLLDIDGSDNNDGDYKVLDTSYDPQTNQTTVFVHGNLEDSVTLGNLQLIGYFFSPGFDAPEECSAPNTDHLYAGIEERIKFIITDIP